MECIRLRVQDLDFEKNIIYVSAGKGNLDIHLQHIYWKTE